MVGWPDWTVFFDSVLHPVVFVESKWVTDWMRPDRDVRPRQRRFMEDREKGGLLCLLCLGDEQKTLILHPGSGDAIMSGKTIDPVKLLALIRKCSS